MTDRKKVLWGINSDEDKLFLSRMCDLSDKSESTGMIMHTRFLTPKEQILISQREDFFQKTEFFGGYEDAERMVAFFISNDWQQRPHVISAVKLTPANKREYSHRDYLGSLLSLGIKRELLGDIAIQDGHAIVFVMEEIADFIVMNLSRIAHTSVKTELLEYPFDIKNEKRFKESSLTVSSLRFDCVLSAVMGKSRADALAIIEEGIASVNYDVVKNGTHKIKDSDVISVRGFGKAIVKTDERLTKKGRIHIEIKKYV